MAVGYGVGYCRFLGFALCQMVKIGTRVKCYCPVIINADHSQTIVNRDLGDVERVAVRI